jgi:hypothetical protein
MRNLKSKRNGVGKPPKYEFHTLEVSGECTIPWVINKRTGLPDESAAIRVLDAIYKCQRRKGWYFQTQGTNYGLLVKRVR